jgi:hypothetical protein
LKEVLPERAAVASHGQLVCVGVARTNASVQGVSCR